MATARQPERATIDDLYKTPSKAELVDGTIKLMPPTGFDTGYRGHAGGSKPGCLRSAARTLDTLSATMSVSW